MTIVNNASPLIGIARIGRLDLLCQLYREMVIPEAVWHEIVVRGAGQPGAEEIRAAEWIRKAHVKNRTLVRVLSQDLASGEAESIAATSMNLTRRDRDLADCSAFQKHGAKSRLHKMLIRCDCIGQFMFLHHNERDTIG